MIKEHDGWDPLIHSFSKYLSRSLHAPGTILGCEDKIMCDMIWNRKGFPGGAVIKHLPTNAETLVPSLGWEDPLEKEMATYVSNFAWKNPMDRGA